jgi:hypothetical protein
MHRHNELHRIWFILHLLQSHWNQLLRGIHICSILLRRDP